jgi:hypothetical protein
MTRKDYNAFAAAFASMTARPPDEPVDYTEGYEAGRIDAAKAIAAILRADNPRFDYGRFALAAKIEGVPVK